MPVDEDDSVRLAAAKLWTKFAICGIIGVAPLLISWWPVAGTLVFGGLAAIAVALAAARGRLVRNSFRKPRLDPTAPESGG